MQWETAEELQLHQVWHRTYKDRPSHTSATEPLNDADIDSKPVIQSSLDLHIS